MICSDIKLKITTEIADISELTIKADSVLIVETVDKLTSEQRANLISAIKEVIGGKDNKIFIMPHGIKLKVLNDGVA